MGSWGITMRQSDYGLELLGTIVDAQLKAVNFLTFMESFKVMVNDTPADFYLDNDATTANGLVWESPENDLIYWIAANLSMDDMIKIAESVEAQETPRQKVS